MANPELTPKWSGDNQRTQGQSLPLMPLAIVFIVILAIAVVIVATRYKSTPTGARGGSVPLVEKKK